MKIESFQTTLASSHAAKEQRLEQTTVARADAPARAVSSLQTSSQSSSQVTLSQQGLAAASSAPPDGASDDVAKETDARYLLIKSLYEQLTGQTLDDSQIHIAGSAQPSGVATPARPSTGAITVTRKIVHQESEQTGFSAQGEVTTQDGQHIHFNLQLNLQRSHSDETTEVERIGPKAAKVKDPLVLNFGNQSASLSGAKFSFDLNGDGNQVNISFPDGGSGFLALDKNGDGVINNGKELFGPGSGDGFADLAQYDQDHNGAIDANDAVFAQLKIFSKDANGQDLLVSLADKGVGAILLDHAATPFDLKDGQNQLQGRVRSTGVYLTESGQAGTVQQVDLRV